MSDVSGTQGGLIGALAFVTLVGASSVGFIAGRATAPPPPVLEQLAIRHNQLAERLVSLERAVAARGSLPPREERRP